MRRVGGSIVGKTNCGELAIGDYVVAGTPANPAAPGRIVSGSSGGCAAAVSAGIVHASVCSDTGGSARIPAAFCAVLGLKLTTGSVALDGVLPLAPSLDALGIIACTTDVLEQVAGVALDRSVTSVPDLRIGVVAPRAARHAGVRRTLDAIARTIASAVVPPPDLTGWTRLHRAVLATEARAIHGHLLDDSRLGNETRRLLGAEPPPRPGPTVRDQLLDELDRSLRGIDVLVTPAVDGPPPLRAPERGSKDFWRQLDWLAPVNHSGHPALVVPVPSDELAGPIAVQLVARHGDEALLVAAARRLDEVGLVRPRAVA